MSVFGYSKVASLEHVGVEAVILAYSTKDGNIFKTGTSRGSDFALQRPDLVTLFLNSVSGSLDNTFSNVFFRCTFEI